MGDSFSLPREKEVWRDSGPLLQLELGGFFAYWLVLVLVLVQVQQVNNG